MAKRQHKGGVEFGLLQFNISAYMNPTGDIWLFMGTSFGDSIDYINTRKGKRTFHYIF
ncbi:MAG: hypothetical protein JSV96_04830 [Candidatus Aminicenantes bacterium]|nr:MAG: hypothetical protein JSV96_04830 [Candidatus Aminicenantes bacterium]